MDIFTLRKKIWEKPLLKKEVYLFVKRRKVKIPIVSNLPELLDRLKIHSLTVTSCISLDVNVFIRMTDVFGKICLLSFLI